MSKLINLLITTIVGVLMTVVIFEHVQALEVEHPVQSFKYEGCITDEIFKQMTDKLGGQLSVTGDVAGGGVFTIVYPDNTIGLYIYLMGTNMICSLGAESLPDDAGLFYGGLPA